MWIVIGIFVYICIYHQSVHVACNWHICTQIKHALERNGAHLFAAFICYICLFLSNITVTILISYKKFSFPWIRANTYSQWHSITQTILFHIRVTDTYGKSTIDKYKVYMLPLQKTQEDESSTGEAKLSQPINWFCATHGPCQIQICANSWLVDLRRGVFSELTAIVSTPITSLSTPFANLAPFPRVRKSISPKYLTQHPINSRDILMLTYCGRSN